MSSFASVLVANAKATPEKVVPWDGQLSVPRPRGRASETHEINADDELRFAPLTALNLSKSLLIRRVLADLRLAVGICLRLHGVVARRGGLLVQLLLVLRRVGVAAAGVDGRRWHGTGRSALVRIGRSAKVRVGGVGVLV